MLLQVPELPVYGCAIPTVAGLRQVLDALGASGGKRQVLWHNMREEPVIYVSNTGTYCLKRTHPETCLDQRLVHVHHWQGWPGQAVRSLA